MRPSRLQKYDFNWIVPELRLLPKQSKAFADVPDDPQYVMNYLNLMFDNNGLDGVTLGEVGSFLLFSPVRPWYANRVEIHELILWVPSEYRGTSIAPRLIRQFVEVAKTYTPHSIHAGSTLDIVDRDRVLALYEKLGFERDVNGVHMRL